MARTDFAGLALLLLGAAPAAGCPVCDAPTAAQVRAGIVGPDFGLNLLGLLLPFAVVLAVVLLLGRPPRPPNPLPHSTPREESRT